MNKTNYIILALILCFSITFIAYPLKTYGGCLPEPPEPPANIDIVCAPPNPNPIWANSCSACGDYSSTRYTCYKWTYPGDCPDDCRNSRDCGAGWGDGTVSSPPVSPPSNGNVPSNGTNGNGVTPPSNGGYTPPAGSPPTLPETQPCMINYFVLPQRAWVGYPITGEWSASDWCDDCDVDCTPYPECVWKKDSIGTGFDEYEFTIEQSGTYDYTLTCYGPGGIDERTEPATVEALNLPWWKEIIPVLQGFLGGMY